MNRTTREDLEKLLNDAIDYLDFYFYKDDGMADKDAVKSYEDLRAMAKAFVEIYNAIPDAKYG